MNVTLTMEDAITNATIHTVHITALVETIIILETIIKLVMVRYIKETYAALVLLCRWTFLKSSAFPELECFFLRTGIEIATR